MNLELAKRAIACKGWQYLDGVKCDDDGKQSTYGVCSWRLANGVWEPLGNGLRARSLNSFKGLPDFDDPATLGCLLALVRKALARPYVTAQPGGVSSNPCEWWFLHINAPQYRLFGGKTEAEALVAALEAAPCKS